MPLKVVHDNRIRLLNIDAKDLSHLSLEKIKNQIHKQIFDQSPEQVTFDLYYTGIQIIRLRRRSH